MSIFLTVLSGVIVFVIGQTVLKIMIEPLQKLRETISEVVFILVSEHTAIHNVDTLTGEKYTEIYDKLKTHAARLIAAQQLIPLYRFIRKVFELPAKGNIESAADKLIGIANHLDSKHQSKHHHLDLYRIEICELLNVHDPIDSGLTKEETINYIKEMREWT